MVKKLKTTRFGEIELNEEEIIHFEKGIPGFEDEQKFMLIVQEDLPFLFLQSVRTSDLSFILTDPFSFFQDYSFDLDDQSKEELEIQDVADISVFGILSIPEDFQQTTINLLAPIIINRQKKKGKQLILHQTNYRTKTPLFPQKAKERGE